MAFTMYIPTRLLFGRGQLDRLGDEILPGKKALIVTSAGGSMKRHGYLARLVAQLERAGAGHVLFDKILPNPIKDHVMEGAALAKAEDCDFIVGLGGGSSIDSAKAIAVMCTNPGDYWDYIGRGSGKGLPLMHRPLPIVAVTTTAGTGTEADPWMVVTKSDTHEKIGFGTDETYPALSVVDPDLMRSVPPQLTAYQGFDALFHSTEGYINRTANPISDLYALKAISLLGGSLAAAVKNGEDMDARTDVALANTLSGMVESTSGCTSEHAMEHAMSAFHPDLPHGAGLIMISAAYYAYFAASGACDSRLVDMARALGKTDAAKPRDFVDALVDLQKACGVDALTMSAYGIRETDLPDLADNALHTMGHLFAVDPVPLSREDCIEIYRKSYR